MNHMISIVIPVYKVEDVLDRCIRSVIAQTYPHWEVILVDDASPDRSSALCDRWVAKDSRIHVIHQSHAGVATARNRGIAAAHGDFLTFIDSDDFVEPNYLSCLVEAQERTNADLVMSSAICEDDAGKPKRQNEQWGFAEQQTINGNEALAVLGATIGCVLWAKLYSRRIVSALHFPDGKIHEDEFVLHHVYYACKTVTLLSEITYHYIDDKPSIMHSEYTVKRLDRIEALIDRLAFYASHNIDRSLITKEFINLNFCLIVSQELPWTSRENKPYFDIIFNKYKTIPISILRKLPLKQRINYIGTRFFPYTFWRLHGRH